MSAPRRVHRDDRLEAYLASLHTSSWKEVLKRSAAHWQLYAAVTGSALAMATNVPVSEAGGLRHIKAGPIPNVSARRLFSTSRERALIRTAGLTSKQNS